MLRDYESFSSLSTYQRCGMQYYFRYCEGIKVPPAVAMIQGSSVHVGLELNDKQKIDTHEDVPVDDVVDATATEFDARAPEVEDWGGEDKCKAKDTAIKVAKIAREVLCPTYQPIECEERYEIEIASTRLLIIPDVVDDTGCIRDRKVVGKAKSQADADGSLQLTAYALGTGMKDVALDCLIKSKEPKVVSLKSTRTDEHFRRFKLLVPALLEGITKEIWLPADPSSWACSIKFCGYWNICKYGGKK